MTQVLKTLTVTMQKGIMHVDGELIITQDAFRFAPYQPAALGPYQFHKQDIAKVEADNVIGKGLVSLSGEAVRIYLKDGQFFEFILTDPTKLIEVLTH